MGLKSGWDRTKKWFGRNKGMIAGAAGGTLVAGPLGTIVGGYAGSELLDEDAPKEPQATETPKK